MKQDKKTDYDSFKSLAEAMKEPATPLPSIPKDNEYFKDLIEGAKEFGSPSIHEEGKFTKGDWKIDLSSYEMDAWKVFGLPVIEVSSPNATGDGMGEWIAMVRGNSKEQAEANAALIAESVTRHKFLKWLEDYTLQCINRKQLGEDIDIVKILDAINAKTKEILSRIK